MPSSKKVKLVSHGSTSGSTKKTTKNDINKKIKPAIDKKAKEINKDLGILQEISNRCNPDEMSYDWDRVEIPHLRGGDWKWNFEKPKMSIPDKITWILTAVNIAILISLVIKNTN